MDKRTLFFRILLGLWLIPLIVLSFYTPPWMETGIMHHLNDKTKHFAGAFILGLLVIKSFPSFPLTKALLLWIVCSSVFEAFQGFATQGQRQFDVRDILMNISGFGIGILVSGLFLLYRQRLKSRY